MTHEIERILSKFLSKEETDELKCNAKETKTEQSHIIWSRVISIVILHILAVYSLFYILFNGAHPLSFIWGFMIGIMGGFGVTVGCHRLWTHKTYKAKPQLEILLLIFYSIAGQNTVPQWVLDHRVHHKYSDTDADPHNSKRGFFFSHCGWLMMRKSREVKEKGKLIDMSDIKNNPYITWHTKYFIPLKILFCFIIPWAVPVYFWNESSLTAFLGLNVLRYAITLNGTWSVNSWAHIWGTKPYDKRICPVDSLPVAMWSLGEGWHNYHHVFPWDYKTGEFNHYRTNLSAMFIDYMAKIGWAYDLKQPSKELVKNVIKKYGDLSVAPEQSENDCKTL
ncbi:hypothetical protein O3M35_009156 [Rhynocoris fuscipes]|uniref:Fatty acid desaturase domain-containing protein n=1 Tax=Rhynocoris fuscipes TaxID=488301 RepID=A0AAW1D8U3_9HEMI